VVSKKKQEAVDAPFIALKLARWMEHACWTKPRERARRYSVSAGCQSSTRFPSGSVIQPNFPKS
jgi:hypothetical protein